MQKDSERVSCTQPFGGWVWRGGFLWERYAFASPVRLNVTGLLAVVQLETNRLCKQECMTEAGRGPD